MKNKKANPAQKTRKKNLPIFRKFLLIQSATLDELDAKLLHAEAMGYQPHGHISSTYDGFFQNHSVMVVRKKK